MHTIRGQFVQLHIQFVYRKIRSPDFRSLSCPCFIVKLKQRYYLYRSIAKYYPCFCMGYLVRFLHIFAVNCGPLSNPKNGKVTFTDTLFGSRATYTCDPINVVLPKLLNSTPSMSQGTCYISSQILELSNYITVVHHLKHSLKFSK